MAAIHQGHRVLYREAHALIEELADAAIDGTRKEVMATFETIALLLIDDLGMRKLPTAAEDLLEVIMRRHQRASTILASNRPIEDWGKLLGDTAAVAAMLDRLLEHGHVLKCGPRREVIPTPLRASWGFPVRRLTSRDLRSTGDATISPPSRAPRYGRF